ncbi:glycoside hydrolase domain-containing protein [Endozoicomonas sp.]|uniref:glycoside hydrolase domain-containing protein n=1 Tax=Endozoicomonas sp. TaxID=1892382 RepID=UPI003AF5F2BA
MGQAIEHTLQKHLWPVVRFIEKTAVKQLSLTACALSFSFFTTVANSEQLLLTEAGSPPFIHTFDQSRFENGSELIISGQNESKKQQILIVRLDNEDSSDYRSRVNQEFTLSPGSFELILPLSGLKASSGKPFKQPYSKLFVFGADMWAGIQLEKILISAASKLPEQTLALDFGSGNSAAFPGFESIGKNSSYLKGKITERVRTSGDSLIRDGISGVTSLQIPWSDGQWKLSLWTQDQGEWEYLPHFLTRQIIANGTTIIDEKFTREQWINNVYLAGRKKEGGIDGDLWSLVGKRRSGFISQNIQVSDGMLNIDLKGDYDARYISALVLEPLDGIFAQATQEKRRERFLNQWSVHNPQYSPPDGLSLEDISQQVKDDEAYYLVARDTILNLTFEIESPVDDIAPVIVVSPPKSSDGKSLKVTTRYGHWRFERPAPNATSLILDDSYLRADMESIQLSNKKPRRLYVQVNVPSEAFSGDYSGKIQLFSRGELKLLDYKVRVLPVVLPKLETPVGLYLEPTPYYQWFKSLEGQTSTATSCDLSLLASHGFSTVAPALPTPDTEASRQEFIQQLKQVKRFGFDGKILAYSPLKRLLQQKSELSAGADLMKLQQLLKDQELPEIYWSIFDEPANDTFSQIKSTARLLKDGSLQFKTAGHLNNESQAELAETTDLLLINHGIEVTEESIKQLQKNSSVWLYNMPEPRLAAGLFLWRSSAEGYLQWHGRMPTADPFDPTDGREGDVMYIYPSANQCPKSLDIHRRFLDLHEATIDLRLIQLLKDKSLSNPKFENTLAGISELISNEWLIASELTNKDMIDIRKMIYLKIINQK